MTCMRVKLTDERESIFRFQDAGGDDEEEGVAL